MKSRIPEHTWEKIYDNVIVYSKHYSNQAVVSAIRAEYDYYISNHEEAKKIYKRPGMEFIKHIKATYPEICAELAKIKYKACGSYQHAVSIPLIYLFAYQSYPKCSWCGKKSHKCMNNGPYTGKLSFCCQLCARRHAKMLIEERNYKKYGVKNTFATPEFLENKEFYFTRKYGENVTAPLLVPGAMEKFKNTSIKHYGVSSPARSLEVKSKIKETCLKKYNTTNYRGSKQERDRISKVLQENDVKSIIDLSKKKNNKSFDIQLANKKRKITSKLNNKAMGINSFFDNPDVVDYATKNACKVKLTAFRSKLVKYQGCEDIVIHKLAQNNNVKNIFTEKQKVGFLQYSYKSATHMYFPDILVILHSKKKVVIEVKSPYTLLNKKFWPINKAKFKAALNFYNKQNIIFILAVVDKKTKTIVSIKHNFSKTNIIKELKSHHLL